MNEDSTRGALNFFPAATAWWSYEGRRHLLTYLGLPAAVGGIVIVFDRQIDDWGSLESGLLFLTGLLMTSLFQVFQWGRDAVSTMERQSDDPHERGRQHRRLEAVERTYRSIVWATIAALALSVTVVVLNTKSADAVAAETPTWATAIIGAMGSHLVLVLITIINRIFIVTRSDLKQANDEVHTRRTKRKASGS